MNVSPDKAVPRTDDAGAEADLDSARRVLRLEMAGLEALARSLGERFVAALDLLGEAKGRVVVAGIGKSGHVARKIAATLASTGTPALFVHPAEASHGDLGMITENDAVFALSNSGETEEIADIIAYAKRFEIPLVAITGKPDSTLAEAASVALIIPENDEACPLGLAPTTSTTVMLALGDAIAVALLERKGFSADNFQELHPGGKLARRLLKVADIMHGEKELPLVDGDTSMADALLVMTAKRFGCVGIINGSGRLEGIVTDGDLRRHMSPELLARKAAEVMSRHPHTITSQALASEAVRTMNERAVTNLFVVDGGPPVGILHIHDCLRAGVA